MKTKRCLPVGADRAEANKKRPLRFNTERSLCCVFHHEKCSSAPRAIRDRSRLLTSTMMRTERCHDTTIYTYMRTYMCVHIYIYVYIYGYTYILYKYVRVCVCIHIYIIQ